jgi:hypothetical protein
MEGDTLQRTYHDGKKELATENRQSESAEGK